MSARPVNGELDRGQPPAPGPLRPSHFPSVERASLPNGIPLLFAATPGLPVVSLGVLIEGGAAHDPPTRAGLATLTGSLLESGAGERGAAEIADHVESLGIQLSVGSSWEISHLDVTGIHARIPQAFEIVGDLARRPTFPDSEVERLRAEQLAGILQRRAEPRGLASEMAARYIFSEDSPFSRPISGLRSTVQAITREDVVEFHADRYRAGGATVLVVGEIDLDEAVRLATAGLGEWGGEAAQAPPITTARRTAGRQVVLVDRPGAVQSEIRIGHLGVPRATPDYFDVIVMNAILGGAFSSRLNLNLRERNGFTYGVSSGFLMRRQPGPFLVSTAVQSEVTAAAVGEIFAELDRIRQDTPTPAELSDARNYLAGTFPLALQTTSGVASRVAEIAAFDLPLDYFDDYRDRILSVSAEDVAAAAQRRVLPDEATLLIVGDAASIRTSIEELGLAEVVVVDPAEVE
jgi:zinc protease